MSSDTAIRAALVVSLWLFIGLFVTFTFNTESPTDVSAVGMWIVVVLVIIVGALMTVGVVKAVPP